MNLRINVLGWALLHISTDPEADDDPGDCVTGHVGFVAPVELPIREPWHMSPLHGE